MSSDQQQRWVEILEQPEKDVDLKKGILQRRPEQDITGIGRDRVGRERRDRDRRKQARERTHEKVYVVLAERSTHNRYPPTGWTM